MAKQAIAARQTVVRQHWNVDECAAYSGLSAWFWRRAAYAGRVESLKAGTRLIIPVSEVERVLSEARRPRVIQTEAISA